MTSDNGSRFWRVVFGAVGLAFGSLALSAVVGEAVCALLVVVAVGLVVRRGIGSSASLRLLAAGCVALGVSPVITEIHRATIGDSLFTSGDAVALAGYFFCLAGLGRLVRVRTVEPQVGVVIDALSITSWCALAISFATVEEVLDAFSGYEQAAALMYLPFTLGLVFMLLRLGLGAGERTASFGLLAAAVIAAAISELLFLEAAVGNGTARRIAIVAASLAIVFFAGAFIHPTSERLEEPRPPTLTRTSGVFAALIGSSVVAVVAVSLVVDLRGFEVGLLLALGLFTAARSVLIVRERDEWLTLQQAVADFSASVVDVDDADAIRSNGVAAAEQIAAKKSLVFVDLRDADHLDHQLLDQLDPAGAELNEIDGDVWRALHTGTTQRREWLVDVARSGYASRVAIPIDAGDAGHVIVIEASPVLSTTEIFHLEMLAAAVGSAVSAAIGRQRELGERANRRFRSLVQDSNDIVMLVDNQTFETRLVSPTIHRLLGYTEEESLDAHPLQFVVAEDGAHLLESMELVVAAAEPVDLRFHHKNGQIRWFAVTIRALQEEEELEGLIVSLSDIHDRKMAELQLGTSERRYRGLVETSRDIFGVVDTDLTINFVSPNINRILQLAPADLVGTNVTEMVAPQSRDAVAELVQSSVDNVDGRSVELQLTNGAGEPRWFEVSFVDGAHTGDDGLVITARDVHARHEIEQSMRQATIHDALTGLYNRPAFQFEVNQSLQSLEKGRSLAVIHLDVRDFKIVNESLGFDAGDELLVAIGGRIRSGLRGSDLLARFGADSFAILTTVEDVADLTALAGRLRSLFDEPFETGHRQWFVSLSMGMAITSSRRDAAVGLLEEAAIAVRQAKAEGGGIVLFEPWMRDIANERFELESDLLPGLRAGEFSVVYQPLLALGTQRVRSVEALLRWHHPERGSVSPGRFIPVAERSGAIVELGRWVLDQSCRQLKAWHDQLPDATGLGVSVNVSVRQLVNEAEFGRLRSIIVDSGVDPSALTLELTESLVISEVPLVRRGIEGLRSMGIRIAVDDFGSGTAGLNHLRDVPFDILKIDKSYVDPLGVNPDAYQLLASVMELAHSMQATVVAEGIETHEQAVLLRRMGCDVGQGFYLGRPMDPVRLEEWFAAGRDGVVASQIAPLSKRRQLRRATTD